MTAPSRGVSGEQKQEQQSTVRCGSNLTKANQNQGVFYLLQCLSAGREPGDAPAWPWEHPPCGPSLYTALHGFPTRRRLSKGWRTCPMRKHWWSQVLSHCKRGGLSQYSGSSRPAKRTEALFSQGSNGEDKRQWVQIAPGEVSSWHKKGIFYDKSSHSLE